MAKLILYGTVGCHLCETAAELIDYVLDGSDYTVEEVDIADSDELLARYGEVIPVLKQLSNNAELYWPFNDEELERFLD